MTSEYMLYWHKDVAYKFKIVWPTTDACLPQHVLQDVMAAVVYMGTTSTLVPQLTTGPFTVTISSGPWEISNYLYFKQSKKVISLFPIQFKLQIGMTKMQTKGVYRETGCKLSNKNNPGIAASCSVQRYEGPTAAVASSSRGLGHADEDPTESSAMPAVAGNTVAKRKINASQDGNKMALVPRKKCLQENIDNIPPAVRECVERVQKHTEKQLVIQKHYLPEAIYQSLLRLSGISENESAIKCTIVFTDPKLCALNKKRPRRAAQHKKRQQPMITVGDDDGQNAGLMAKISKAITAPFKIVQKWLG